MRTQTPTARSSLPLRSGHAGRELGNLRRARLEFLLQGLSLAAHLYGRGEGREGEEVLK